MFEQDTESMNIIDSSEVDPNLLRMLDRGIDDVFDGRTLPHKEAMEAVERIRIQRGSSSGLKKTQMA